MQPMNTEVTAPRPSSAGGARRSGRRVAVASVSGIDLQPAQPFADLSTPLVADACLRCDVPLRAAPHGIAAVRPRARVAGRVLPARHYGSVDVFLEALDS